MTSDSKQNNCCSKCECTCADCSVGASSDCLFPECPCHSPSISNWEQTRQEIEKILWSAYTPNMSPNMEEVSEKILAVVLQSVVEEVEKKKTTCKCEGTCYGYNRAIDDTISHLKDIISQQEEH